MTARGLLIVLAACSDSGSATPDASPAPPRETVMNQRVLLVGEIVEATLLGGPGDRAVIDLRAPVAALDWNLHGHANGGTQVVEEQLGVMTATYTFEPGATAAWSLLVRNQHAAPLTVDATIELYGAMAWTSW